MSPFEVPATDEELERVEELRAACGAPIRDPVRIHDLMREIRRMQQARLREMERQQFNESIRGRN